MRCLIVTFLFLLACSSHADILQSNKGLEASDPKNITYILSLINKSEASLTEQAISSQIELHFRSQGIRPTAATGAPTSPFLHVIVIVHPKGGFNIMVSFRRRVMFTVGEQSYFTIATTWEDGTYGTGTDPDFVMRGTTDYIDQFLAAYLKANEK